MERWIYKVYYLMLIGQLISVWKTWGNVEVMYNSWHNHHDLMKKSSPHTVKSWPFRGAVRVFILNHDCEDVEAAKERIMNDALAEKDHASCVIEQDENHSWHYWPPELAEASRWQTAVNASDEVKRRLSGDALQRLEDSAGTVEHAAAEVQEGFDDFLHIARRSFNFTDPGHIVVRNELCTHHQMYFGKVGLTDKYFNAILLGNTAKNAAEEAAKEGCPKHSTWCGPPTEEKDWSQKRKQEYDLLQYCLFACLVIKLGITKLNSCMAKLSDRFISSRSRCDKRWESMFMEVFSSVLFICLQTTLSTMFLLVWRVNSAIATNIPTWGLVSCVGFFFLISTVNELDKFCDLSAKHCNACWTLVFWIGFVGCVLFITIPLVSLTFFNLQFFFQVYQCHLSKKVRSGVPSQLKESSDNCCFFTAIFVLFAVAELVLLACIDWHETERERRPTTMPHKVKGTPYTLVDWKEASEAA
ncbi:unnamed protein product [Durusdinium trenchii]|uniref:Uncharacterized protein n=2 Tax=Durusdinium trenchii TaxID=1381693 RepID=A0ABP0N025_9DINO